MGLVRQDYFYIKEPISEESKETPRLARHGLSFADDADEDLMLRQRPTVVGKNPGLERPRRLEKMSSERLSQTLKIDVS